MPVHDSSPPLSVAIVGATGYTGAELLRLLGRHPRVDIRRIYGGSKAGQNIADVLPSYAGVYTGEVAAFDADDLAAHAKVAFSALPHAASAPIVSSLLDRGVVVFDLSADFRLRDRSVYEAWYGPHAAVERFDQGAYGLVEYHREAIAAADLVAVPGCFPTAALLALSPLVEAGLIECQGLIIDAKTGVSGAGRTPLPTTHFPECAEGVRAYKVGGKHRHIPEIEQELSRLTDSKATVLFTPHLVPMTRGILVTAYARLRGEVNAADITAADITAADITAADITERVRTRYAQSPSVVVRDADASIDTAWVRGSNRAQLAYSVDARSNIVMAQAAIDNLVKGAAGQAVQAMNVRFGFDEGLGLMETATWP